ncbi:MAG: polysaccharide pyruvyl transferase family protein [Cyclobacteriaceae bacterium]
MRRLNIIFSTTRQWNPGDEFILMGCINILKKITDFNPIIYNKHPQIRYVIGWKRKFLNKVFRSLFRIPLFSPFLDNSIKPSSSGKAIDLVVFAGSPAWYGEPSRDLFQFILKYKVPTVFLGIGTGEVLDLNSFKDYEKEVFKNADLILTRDNKTGNLLGQYNALHKPCPAIFSSKTMRKVDGVKKIGLIYATHKSPKDNRVSEEISSYIQGFYMRLVNEFSDIQFEMVCHYIDELECVTEEFPDHTIHYSYDSADYIDIYNQYDFVIGTRVHGLGLSASLGIPGIMISHDLRSETVKGFLSVIMDSNIPIEENLKSAKQAIDQAEEQSTLLAKHKSETEKFYLEKLRAVNVLKLRNS